MSSPRAGFSNKFNVTALCTTDDPVDDLSHHQSAIADEGSLATRRCLPAYRPDKAVVRASQPDRMERMARKVVRGE